MLSITRLTLQDYINQDQLLPTYNELLQKPVDVQGNISWIGVDLKQSCLQQVKNAKRAFLKELLENLDRTFPDDGR